MLSKRSKNTKIVLFATMMMAMLMVACGGKAVPSGSADYVGKDHETVKAELTEAGFTDIQEEPIDDLTSARIKEDGAVESVTIGDQSEFDAKSKFAAETKILIKYHRLPKIAFPLEETVVKETEASELAKKLTDAGYTNVEIEALYDMDPDEKNSAFENEIKISGYEKMQSGDEIPFDAAIKVITHYPYVKYDVKLVVNYELNILFSKYQIDILVDGEKIAELKNSQEGEYELRLKEGDHEITVEKTGDHTVKGKISLTVDADMEVSYRIKSHADIIDVENVYIDKAVKLALNEAKIMKDYSAFWGMPYEKVKAEIEGWGFTNIELNPVYSEKKGSTYTGLVNDVTINGSTDFKRGEILDKTVKIVITYLMPEDEDPAKKVTPTPTATPTPTPTKEATPSPTAAPTPEPQKSVYEYAFVLRNSNGYIYYLFDMDSSTARYFTATDTSVTTGTFTGELTSGLTVSFDVGDGSPWSEKFKYPGAGKKAVMTDHSGFDFEFEVCEVSEAEEVLYGFCKFEETLSE